MAMGSAMAMKSPDAKTAQLATLTPMPQMPELAYSQMTRAKSVTRMAASPSKTLMVMASAMAMKSQGARTAQLATSTRQPLMLDHASSPMATARPVMAPVA
jgi:hypothetical protein